MVAPYESIAVHGVVVADRLAQGGGGGLVHLAQVPGGRPRAGKGPRADGAGEGPQHHVRPLVARQARAGLEARPALPADVRHSRRLAHSVLAVRATWPPGRREGAPFCYTPSNWGAGYRFQTLHTIHPKTDH